MDFFLKMFTTLLDKSVEDLPESSSLIWHISANNNLFICKMGNISTGIGGFKLALKNGARPLKLFVNKERIKDIDAFLYYYFEEGIDK